MVDYRKIRLWCSQYTLIDVWRGAKREGAVPRIYRRNRFPPLFILAVLTNFFSKFFSRIRTNHQWSFTGYLSLGARWLTGLTHSSFLWLLGRGTWGKFLASPFRRRWQFPCSMEIYTPLSYLGGKSPSTLNQKAVNFSWMENSRTSMLRRSIAYWRQRFLVKISSTMRQTRSSWSKKRYAQWRL